MKNLNYKLVFVFLFMICGIQMNAQVSGAATASPNSNSIPKFQTGVNMLTGAATVGLPLMTVTSDNVSMPISLNYTATQGVPVGMIASNVGLGWNLSYGGVVTREVKDKPDDVYTSRGINRVGYLYNGYRIDNLYDGDFPIADQDWDDIKANEIDLEPDVFHFSFGGYSGSFVFDKDGNPKLLSKQDIKIEYNRSSNADVLAIYGYPYDQPDDDYEGAILSFKITTPDGSQYFFNKIEVNLNYTYQHPQHFTQAIGECDFPVGDPVDFLLDIYGQSTSGKMYPTVSSWMLTKINSPLGKEEVVLNYDKEITQDHSTILSQSVVTSDCEAYGTNQSIYTKTLGWRCKEILFSRGGTFGTDGKVVFNYNADREDLYGRSDSQVSASEKPKKLNSIIWEKNGLDFKRIDFVQTYFESDEGSCFKDWAQAHQKRLRLNQINISGTNASGQVTSTPPITFGYNDTNLPSRHSAARDYWGFFNGSTSEYMKPKTYYYPTDANNNTKYQSPFSIFKRENYTGLEEEYGTTMMPSADHMIANMLTSISYPTGLTQSFTYEPNTAYFENTEVISGGLRIKNIASNIQALRSFEYTSIDGNSSGRILSLPQLGLDLESCQNSTNYGGNVQLNSWSRNDLNVDKISTAYERVTEVAEGFGSTETTFDLEVQLGVEFGGCVGSSCAYFKSFYQYNRHPDPDNNERAHSDRAFYPAINPNFAWKQGLPISTTVKKNDGSIISETVNEYKIYGYEKIKGITAFKTEYGNIRAFSKFHYLSGDARIEKTTQTSYGLGGNSIVKETFYEYNNPDYRMPTKVYFINDDGKEYGVESSFVNEVLPGSNPYKDRDEALRLCSAGDYDDCIIGCAHDCQAGEAYGCSQACIDDCQQYYDDCAQDVLSAFEAALNALSEAEQVAAWMDYTCRGWFPAETKKLAGSIVGGTKYDYANDYEACPDCPLVKRTYSWEDGWKLDGEIVAYNNYGRSTEVDTRDFYNTRYDYTTAGLLEYTRVGDGTPNGDFVTQNVYNDLNQLEMTISADEQKVRLAYDGLGQVVQSESRFSGDDPNVRVNNIYDLANNTVSTSTWLSDVPFVPDEFEQLDVLGRMISTTSIGYTPQGNDYVTSTSYDPLGRPLRQCDPASGGCTTYLYEAGSPVSQETKVSPPNWPRDVVSKNFVSSDITIAGYPGGTSFYKNLTIDENGQESAVYTDKAGKKVLSRQYRTGGSPVDVIYLYDGKDRLQTVIQPEGQTFTYTYQRNNDGWLTTKSIPGGETVTTQKDNRGLILTVTDHNFTTTYEYDDFGREIKSDVGPVGGTGALATQTKYYESGKGQRGQIEWIDHAVLEGSQITDKMLRTSYTYDEFGRSLGTSSQSLLGTDSDFINPEDIDHSDFVKVSTHTHQGLEQMTTVSTNTRDHSARLIGVDFKINGVEKRVGTYHYDEADRMIMKNLGGANEQTSLEDVPYTYNGRGWLTSIGRVGKCVGGPDAGPDFPGDPDGPIGNLGTVTTDLIEVFFDRTALCDYDAENKAGTGTAMQMIYKIQEENPVTGDIFVDFADTTLIELGEVDIEDEILTDLFSISSEYRSCISLCPGSPKEMLQTIIEGIRKEVPCLPTNNQVALDQIEIAVNNALTRLPSCDECIDTKGLFAEGIFYNDALQFQQDNGFIAKAQYNGNISHVIYGVKWRKADSEYGFAYDELNRLIEGRYQERKHPGTYSDPRDLFINQGMYDVDFTYTDNGNLSSIRRQGYLNGVWPNQNQIEIDKMTLTHNGENQLSGATDDALAHKGFKGGSGYGYQDGKLVSEGGKGITSILYNHLDKPYLIEKNNGNIRMIYDASGRLLQRVFEPILPGGQFAPTIVHDYAGGMEYRNQKLINVPHPEGRYYWDSEDGTYRWEYTLTDHLGNGRVWFTDRDGDGKISIKPDKREITQEAHYYPFGMKMDGDFRFTEQVPQDQYQYNGIDYVSEMDMDVNMAFYRTLDPATGHWWSVDPKAEAAMGMSPYTSMFCNPISRADPAGDYAFFATIGPTISFNGGFSVGVGASAGLGFGDYFSLQVNAGWSHNFSSGENGWNAGAGVTALWGVVNLGYNTSSGWGGSFGYGLGQPGSTGFHGGIGLSFSQNGGVGWSVSGGYSARFEHEITRAAQGNSTDATEQTKSSNGGKQSLGDDYDWLFEDYSGGANVSDAENNNPILKLLAKLLKKRLSKVKRAKSRKNANKKASKLPTINTPQDLIKSAGKLKRGKGGVRIGSVKGNVDDIFTKLTQGGKRIPRSNSYKLPDGTIVGRHVSKHGVGNTIDVNNVTGIFKIRITL